jgi:Flp pilus assembly protein TadG
MQGFSISIYSGQRRQRNWKRGSALMEVTLIAPWFLFLSVGVFDVGIYSYSLVAVENATRVAATYTSQSSTVAADQAGACRKVMAELGSLPNVSGLSNNCNSIPLIVTAASVTGPDGQPATSVSVTYQSSRLIAIPGLLRGQLNVTRNLQMRTKP